jgi:hypothetical protein
MREIPRYFTLPAVLVLALFFLSGCSAADAPADTPQVAAETELDASSRGSGSIGGWRSRPGQRTVFDRGFQIPTTISFRADAGSWSGNVSIVDRTTNSSLCQRSISGGGSASCFGIQGNFRITVANDASSRDTATGQIRFNN